MTRLSIALCTCNGARFLPKLLDSLAAQTRQPDELVVCDDQSTDATPQIIEQVTGRVPFAVRWQRNDQRLGSTKNFERAIGLCQGDLIALCDQDDVWLPDKLAHLETALAATPRAGAVFSDAEIVDENLRPLGRRLWEAGNFRPADQQQMRAGHGFAVLLKRQVAVGMTMAFRADFRRHLLPIPREWVHDGWITLIIAAQADLAFLPEPLVQYRQHPRQQLGAGMTGGWPQRSPNYFRTEAEKFQMLHERLAGLDPASLRPEVLVQVQATVTHMRARAALPDSKFGRLPVVLGELCSGRYHRYSNAWKSAGRDLGFH